VLVIAAAVLLVVAGGGLVLVSRNDRDHARSPSAAPTTTATTTPPTTTPTQPSSIQARIKQIEAKVAKVRGLGFTRAVPASVLPSAKLEKQLLGEIDSETDTSDLRGYSRALVLLGEMSGDTDLVKLLRRVQAESVLGFYVPGRGGPKGRLYVRSEGGLTPFTEWVLSHELTHAVTDQHFDLTRADRLEAGGKDDELLAYTALVEGDATLAMQEYLRTQMDPNAQAAVATEGLSQSTPQLDKAPSVVRESLNFPYEAGLSFVQALYQRGGWAAVNKAYADPPTSSEQILHPAKYLNRDQPTPVSVPDLTSALGGGWTKGTDAGWGEFDTRVLLGDAVPVSAAGGAAAGWDGGRVRTFENGRSTALVLRTAWDSPAEAREYCQTTVRWANDRFGPGTGSGGTGVARWSGRGQQTALVCQGARAAWLSAPDAATLTRLQRGLGNP
jgi:hypothetical protein